MDLVLIGCARLSRSHYQIKNLLNSYRAGAHCNLITFDFSALFSVSRSHFGKLESFVKLSRVQPLTFSSRRIPSMVARKSLSLPVGAVLLFQAAWLAHIPGQRDQEDLSVFL